MSKFLKFIGIFFIAVTTLTSCSSDDSDSNNVDDNLLVDKWWYSADGSASDLYFNSNGNYEQVFVFGGMEIESTGKWEWVNQSSGVVRVYDLVGNAVDEFYAKVTDLNADTMTIKISFDGGETFTDGTADYQDTNN